MDIPALSIAMSTAQLQTDWGMAMLSNSMDMAEITSDAMTKMLEASVTPNLGQNIDIRL